MYHREIPFIKNLSDERKVVSDLSAQEIEKLISEDAPLIPLFHEKYMGSWNPNLRHLCVSPMGDHFITYLGVWKK